MKKILNWIFVIIVASLIGGFAISLMCNAKIYDGMTEIKHIYNGMTPIYSIYDGPSSAIGASNITFVTFSSNFVYIRENIAGLIGGGPKGSSSISNNDLLYIQQRNIGAFQNLPHYGLYIYLKRSLTKLKTPISISVDGTSYDLTWYTYAPAQSNNTYAAWVTTLALSPSDQITDSDLTKAIDFEFVDNYQLTFALFATNFYQNTNSDFAVFFKFTTANATVGDVPVPPQYAYIISYTGSKTPTHLIMNGFQIPITYTAPNGNYYRTDAVTNSNFRVTGTNLNWGVNLKFSDGTYLNNTRSKLFARTGASQIYRRPVVPVITSFSVTPTTIDLDNRLTGTISFSLGVTGTAGQVTTARIIRVRDNAQIGTTFTGGSGLNLSQTLPNIAQPLRTETYRLIATNTDGNSHRDATVTVTKNPTLTNCRRTNYIDATTLYEFAFNLTGLPRPSVRYVFTQNSIAGQQGQVPYNHYAQGSNPYTFNVTGWRINFANSNARSLRLTASNSSGSSSCVINNIND